MKNQRIVLAYDSINPTAAEKEQMLQAIFVPAPAKPKISRKSLQSAIAVCVVLLVLSVFGLLWISRSRPEGAVNSLQIGSQNPEESLSPYARVLQKYSRALEEGWDEKLCQIEDISVKFASTEFARANAGYQLIDLNSDGREELIVGSGDTVWDLYTLLEDGTPVHLHTDEGDGTLCMLYQGGIIGIELTTKTDGEYGFYRLEENRFVAEEMLRCYDIEWSRESGEQGWEVISRENAEEILDKYEKIPLKLTRISDAPEYIETGNEAVEFYALVLEKYKTALIETWDMGMCAESDISNMVSIFNDEPEKLCVSLMDLDADGVQELIITDGMMIYDLYTLKENVPVKLLTGWERNSYQLCENNYIFNQGSNGAAITIYHYYRIQNGELTLVESIHFNAAQDPDNPWFRSPDGILLGDPLTEQEAQEILNSYQNVPIPGTSILEIP